VAVFAIFALGCWGGEGETYNPEGSAGGTHTLCSPIGVNLELKGAALSEGVRLRAQMENRGSEPYALSVCPNMLMSCVVGAHVLIRQAGWSAGLLDVCSTPKPSGREALLPPNASYGFDLTIPMERLPKSLTENGDGFTLQLLYEIEDQRCAESNVVQVNWN
jgi:hypothetical protein